MEEKNQGAATPQAAGLSSNDHPGGPLSRAERVLLRQLNRNAMQARTLVYGMIHVLGAIPGAQKIEAAHKEAVTALDRFCLAMKTRKQGAPFPNGEPKVNPSKTAPESLSESRAQEEMLVCLRHWYECKGCPLCQAVRDHYAREDTQHADLVKKIMASLPPPPSDSKG